MPTSTVSEDRTELLAQRVREAARHRAALRIRGGGTKSFYGRPTMGRVLDMSAHAGVIAYEPSELVITARAGTRLSQIETLLASHGQMLAFEPPRLGPASTIGGVVAAGLAGPRRPFAGAVRDFLLGVTILDGRARRLRFGGTVFKNVAGFDVFRPMAGALGSLGVMLDVSLKVTPRPAAERALAFTESWADAQARLTEIMRRPLPISGAFHDGERLFLRLSGTKKAVASAQVAVGGDKASLKVWDTLRNLRLEIFKAPKLWRLSVPRTRATADLPGVWLMDWAGAQRWLASDAPDDAVRAVAREAGGHATLFHGTTADDAVFEPLPPPLMALHQRLKLALDPAGIFNRGRLYEGL